MLIVFTNNIVSIKKFPKYKEICPSYYIARNYKKKIGHRYWLFPVYEVIEEAVIKGGWSLEEFLCELKDFESDQYFFEGDDLYNKPHCEIRMSDGKCVTKWFKTIEELDSFVEETTSKAPHIII